jgi:ABC-type enterobactin transport system permease subunit
MTKTEKVGLLLLLGAQSLFILMLVEDEPLGMMFVFLLIGGVFLFWLGR